MVVIKPQPIYHAGSGEKNSNKDTGLNSEKAGTSKVVFLLSEYKRNTLIICLSEHPVGDLGKGQK